MATLFSLIFVLSAVSVWYFIKKRPNKKIRNYSIIALVISFLLVNVTAPKSEKEAVSDSPKQEEKTKPTSKEKESTEPSSSDNSTALLEAAQKGVENAEQNPTRDNYNQAVSALEKAGGEKSLEERLIAVNEILVSAEAQAAEAAKLAEEQRITAEQERIAQEQAQAATAEQQRIADEQAQTAAQQVTEHLVYVAPESGTKYHYSSTCRGLRNANSVISMHESEALANYTLCGFED
ncbi:hypothetical protein LI951_05410 [Enterococcus sp. BWT-B8]|uniref:hypothetical protein n=1 Tax=unclassified Enterococcus TaxID=2608891 RepID=UPI001E2C3275|nr:MULTISPECIES: hypothetical protein [unclassified Enterococcus]MCB5951496.1 hypothetical protein [Enterococcus sp. BWT-B8]MCB5955055.1 hypothetical protein [Enterococcus sp. CWB-B31]